MAEAIVDRLETVDVQQHQCGLFVFPLRCRERAGELDIETAAREQSRELVFIEALEDDFGLQPVLVGGPGAAEREIADRTLALTRARSVIDTLGDDLRRLVWTVDGSALVISPDTGPLHIARALETPVVGLFGYTNPKRSGPWRRDEDLVVDGYARTPGEAYPITPEYRDGMKRVTVEGVLEKVALARTKYGW